MAGTLAEVLDRLGLGFALHLFPCSREAEAHAGQRHVLHLGRSLRDAHEVAPLQHDLGLALPAFDLAVVAITRRDGEITGAQLHLPTLGIVTQRGHGGLHDLLQLGLNGRSIDHPCWQTGLPSSSPA
jgi:hypothetical protein